MNVRTGRMGCRHHVQVVDFMHGYFTNLVPKSGIIIACHQGPRHGCCHPGLLIICRWCAAEHMFLGLLLSWRFCMELMFLYVKEKHSFTMSGLPGCEWIVPLRPRTAIGSEEHLEA